MSNNAQIVRQQILHKMAPYPYFPPTPQIFNVQTDVNSQPYHRFFRGRPESNEAIVWEREAGYARIQSQTTMPSTTSVVGGEGMCFQIPCSTVLPCRSTTSKPFQANGSYCVYTSP
jgi:hypothetical protein